MFLTVPPLFLRELGYLFELCQMGHIGEMFVRKRACARIQPRFFPLSQLSLTGKPAAGLWKDGLLIVLCHAELLDF